MKKSYLIIYVLVVLLYSCSKNSTDAAPLIEDTFVRAADVSYLPLIESEGIIYKHNGQSENALITLKNAGCNTIRIRLWKNPIDGRCAKIITLTQNWLAFLFKIKIYVNFRHLTN